MLRRGRALEDNNITISGDSSHAAATASSLAITSFGIPLTGSSMSAGFIVNFIKS
jgi:hypothetical protein